MSLAPLDLISAHPWRRVAFTTYALSLSFFEAVILDALVRGRAGEALIFTDVEGVRESLSEQGAQRVGKDYEVEPVSVTGGVFHPKISVLSDAEECHLLVGSGNLTFNGWGGNCEILEHLHAGFAPDAIADAANFFELIPATERIRQHADRECAAIAAELRRSVQGKPRNGNIRLLHNLEKSISEQLVEVVGDLGGAERIMVAAPFWDQGAAIDHLCKAIGLDHVYLHVHPQGCVEGFAGSNWPAKCRTRVRAIEIKEIAGQGRRLHAKAFEILCKRGRLLLSGSANGTTAALERDHNVEACVVRIERQRWAGWKFSTSEPPELQAALESDTGDDDEAPGVLRAVLDADEVRGEVLTPAMSGPASVFQMTSVGPELLAETSLSAEGAFRLSAPALEERSWLGGRLVIRVRDKAGRQAEGFVSVASFADITRRAGVVGRRLFAMLAGTETPADVAAIMSWFYEDPRRLGEAVAGPISGVSDGPAPPEPVAMVPVAELEGNYDDSLPVRSGHGPAGSRNWSRFMDHVFKAFRERRGPFGRPSAGGKGEDDEDERPETTPEPPVDDPAIEKSLAVFDRLFDLLLSPEDAPRHALVAFDLTQYICERLQPDAARAKGWVERLIRGLLNSAVPPERRNDVAGAILVVLGTRPDPGGYRWARDCLLRLGMDLFGDAPSLDTVKGFESIFPPTVADSELWPRVRDVRTYPEQIKAYLRALDNSKPGEGYGDLPREAHEEWPALEEALTSESARKRILQLQRWQEACPRCYIKLPESEVFKLRSTCVATAKNCCNRVVVWTGG